MIEIELQTKATSLIIYFKLHTHEVFKCFQGRIQNKTKRVVALAGDHPVIGAWRGVWAYPQLRSEKQGSKRFNLIQRRDKMYLFQ